MLGATGPTGFAAPARLTWIRRVGSALPVAALALVLVGSALLHLWGIRGDLPYGYMVDEPYFVDPAIRVSSGDTLDPGWAGHPGSTVIYPHVPGPEIGGPEIRVYRLRTGPES